jgi:triphosphoribosyl-dephospho-CoA synthase
MPRFTASGVAQAVELACRLEVSAPKPGNVSPSRSFGDMHYEDFLASAQAIAPVLGTADQRPLGATIRAAIEATRQRTSANTNLGIVLLLAPLARAALLKAPPLREGVQRVMAASTVADAVEVYRAIRLAAPSGMGAAAEQDLTGEPSISLLGTMKLAADRDGVAAEYASDYQTTFEVSVPTLRQARADGLEWPDAVVEVYLALLASRPEGGGRSGRRRLPPRRGGRGRRRGPDPGRKGRARRV